MSGKLTKKGKNPGAVDNWLDTLGLYRKNVAYDETCLFRAVSEQLFDCQVYHERVRKDCIEYARENYQEFRNLVENEEKWHKHIDSLQKHMVVCGNIEINIVSKKYSRDIVLFHAAQQQVYNVTKCNLPNPILLCLMDEDHYDAVYEREHILTAGFCQSIIYKILYEEVFKIQNIDDIVKAMLYDKTSIISQVEVGAEQKKSVTEDANLESEETNVININIAPFPFKVAKALDPTIYRNIEYDSWGEVRREMRLGDWYYGDNKLILGTRCVLNDRHTGETFDCYIQEIIQNENMCVVYLTKLAERRTVNYSDLSPENDAKPWPLPYRFSKNLVIGCTTQLPPADKIRNMRKRNKDKRRTKSCSESSLTLNVPAVSSEPAENVSAYVGAPLQMKKSIENNNYEVQAETAVEVSEVPPSQLPSEMLLTPVTPETQVYPNSRCQWEQPQWQTPYSNQIFWPQTPTTPQNAFTYELKPVASAPVTPSVIPYHDQNFSYIYNYPMETYQVYNNWSSPNSHFQPQMQPNFQDQQADADEEPTINESIQHNELNNNYTQIPSQAYSLVQSPIPYTPQNPQAIEVYSPILPIPPGTPVIYTQPEVTDVVMPTTPIAVYTPTPDVQYMSPGTYMYPPTPPTAWYPHGVTAQGFMFPTPVNNQK